MSLFERLFGKTPKTSMSAKAPAQTTEAERRRSQDAPKTPPTSPIDLGQVKAQMVVFAQSGKTMEFLAESNKARGSEIAQIAAEVLASEPAFAETLASELATFYTYLRDQLGRGNDIAGEAAAKRMMDPKEFMDMGRAAHLLMRAMRGEPTLCQRTAIVESLSRVEHSSDSFVSGNAQEALRIARKSA